MAISERFKRFSEQECSGSSRLYEILSAHVAEDEAVLRLAAETENNQPIPNLLFASVHYLLLSGAEHPLKRFYRSLTEQPASPEDAYPYFADFCRKNSKAIAELLKSRLVQTNEVRRCAYLYPSFCYIQRSADRPLAIIELGTSSGVNLLWDQYRYTYPGLGVFGNLESEVRLTSDSRGQRLPYLSEEPPEVALRIGLDLHIIDLLDKDEFLWMKALIWPDHTKRMAMFERAAGQVHQYAPDLREGDGLELLPGLINEVPYGYAICLYHTHVANQLSIGARKKLLEMVKGIGAKRDIYHLYNNVKDRYLRLDSYMSGVHRHELLAETDGHGRWFEWLLEE
ncbi:MAG: DUF2332 domain-containing protein [Bacillus sp. (in: firmicutes)]